MLRSTSGYDLAPPERRDAPVGKEGKVPAPMSDNEVKPDWAGKTKDELLALPDLLPDYVRRLPRAHLFGGIVDTPGFRLQPAVSQDPGRQPQPPSSISPMEIDDPDIGESFMDFNDSDSEKENTRRRRRSSTHSTSSDSESDDKNSDGEEDLGID